MGQRLSWERAVAFILYEMIKQADLDVGQRKNRRRIRGRTVEHRHPEDPPTQDAKDRDQIGKALGGPEFRFLSFAARFEDFMKHLDFPPQRIPFELLNSVLARLNGQVSDQLPLDFLSVLRCPALLGMDHR